MVELRAATIDDLGILRYWDEQPHVIESGPNDDWAWEVELKRTPYWREQLIAEISNRPIGFIQIIDPALEDSHYWGKIQTGFRAIDIWIGDKADLGKGYGTQMMCLALSRCFENNSVSGVLIDPLESNIRAHRFYERHGFEFLERRRFGKDECFVYCLSRTKYTQIAQQNNRT